MENNNSQHDKHQEKMELFKKAIEEGLSEKFDQIVNGIELKKVSQTNNVDKKN